MRSATVDVDTDEITEAFRKGKELLMSGQLPRIKQLIELYVSRVEVYPEYVTVKLNYMPALQASASDGTLGQLSDTYEKAHQGGIGVKIIPRRNCRGIESCFAISYIPYNVYCDPQEVFPRFELLS